MAFSHFRDVHLTSTGCDVTEVSAVLSRLKPKHLKYKIDIADGLYVVENQFGVEAADLNASFRFLVDKVTVNASPWPQAVEARLKSLFESFALVGVHLLKSVHGACR